jgi:hypothetical protein
VDTDVVVLAAATAVVAVAQAGILLLARPRRIRDAVWAGIPALGIAALLTLAWRSVAG